MRYPEQGQRLGHRQKTPERHMKTTHLHGRHFRSHLTTYDEAAKVALARSLGGGVDEASGAGFRPDVMTCAWMEGVS